MWVLSTHMQPNNLKNWRWLMSKSKIRYSATGRRKVASARIWLTPGSGVITINNRSMDSYFGREVLQMIIKQPFEASEVAERYDVFATVVGGGLAGQAGAVRHGISRALAKIDE